MSIAEKSVRRSVTTVMLYVCLTGFGIYAFDLLPLNRLPSVELPVVAIVTSYPGARPEDVESLVTAPLERAIASVEGVETIASQSRQGISLVVIYFTWGRAMAEAEVDVRKNIEVFASDDLPAGASHPLTFAFDPSISPVVFLGIDGPMDPARLRRIAVEHVQPRLSRIDGVAAAEVVGGREREVRVVLQPERLQSAGLSALHVVEALRDANVDVAGSAIDDGLQQLALSPRGRFESVEEIRGVTVGTQGGRAIRLADVAEVQDTFSEEMHVVTADDQPAVLLSVRKQSDANTVQVSRAVNAALRRIEHELPEGVHLVPFFDEALPIDRAVGNLNEAAMIGFVLTGLVLLAFLRSARASLITLIAVPISVAITFVAMLALDVSLNLVSLAGLVLAVGMIVDDAIVILEATYRHFEEGLPPARAAVEAVEEMGMPVVASTLTSIVVFVPILLVEGIAGELFRDMVITICASLLASLLVAVTLVPLLAAYLVRDERGSRLTAFLARSTAFIDRLEPIYLRFLDRSMRHRWLVLGATALLFAGSLALAPLLGRDFLPKSDISDIRISVTAAPGTSLEVMREKVRRVEDIIREEAPEARRLTTDFGEAPGFQAIFGGAANRGRIRVRLCPPDERERSQPEIEDALAARFRALPDVDVEMLQMSLDGSQGGDLDVEIFGEDLDSIRRFGEQVRDDMSEIEGVREARFSMAQGNPEIEVAFDRQRMLALGLSPAAVASEIAVQYQGVPATVLRDQGDELPVRVTGPIAARSDFDGLRYLPLRRPFGPPVPLSSVASFGDRLGPAEIEHENQRRVARVRIIASGRDLGALTDRVRERLATIDVPSDLAVEIGGTAEKLQDAFFKLALAIAAAIALVYMVMASEFESLFEPLVIMVTVPLAVIGVIGALFVTNTSLQVTALIGQILLSGIVVKNGIVLVDVLKQRRAEGRDLVAAALEAGRTRLRPILMTASTTILGMVPSALGTGDGAEIWAPLARAVVGGMVVSTVLTLFVVPVLYVSIASFVDRRRPAVA